MKLPRVFEKHAAYWFLLISAVIFFILRLPSLFEPYWYGDEGIYQTMGLAISRGALLYKEIWDNKPPLLYLLYAVFAGDQFSLRVASLISGIASIFLFFSLTKKLFPLLTKIPYIATALYVFLFATPLIEGNIANAENFMIIPILLAAILVVTYQNLQRPSMLFWTGIFASVAFLFKIVGVFDFAAFLVFLGLINLKTLRSLPHTIKGVFPYGAGFIIPIGITAAYFALAGAFTEFYQGAFTNMVGYVGHGNQFIIPQGLLLLKLAALCIGVLLLFLYRNRLPSNFIFLISWILFSAFNALFAQRPYIHYLLVLMPGFSILTAYIIVLLFTEERNRIPSSKINLAMIGLFVIVVFAISNTFRLYNKPLSYYGNFYAFVTNQKDTMSYYQFFDGNTPKDYEIAQFVQTHTNENDEIFIWGNNAQVYKMTNKLPPGRFTVAYHMTANQETLLETKKALEKQNPKYIIVTSPRNPLPYQLSGYSHRISIRDALVYEKNY